MALLFLILIADHSQRVHVSILGWFGLKIDTQVIINTFKALILNSVLFSGEIFMLVMGLTYNAYRLDIECLKNLVVAPFFEEFIYRVCMINLMIESNSLDEATAVLTLPLFFAISHLHHELVVDRVRDWKMVFARCLFKLAYTQIFGIYAGRIYVRTGSIWPAFALHS
jgi:predicted Abi (CAAX) family protease